MTPEQRERRERELIAKYPRLDNLITFLLQGGGADPRANRRPSSQRRTVELRGLPYRFK